MPSFQPEDRPVTINGVTIYLRGTVEYDINTGARLSTQIRDVLTYADVVARAGLSGTPTVTYTDVHGTKTIAPGDSIQPLDGSSFVVR